MALLTVISVKWPSNAAPPRGCTREEVLPALQVMEKVMEKGSKAQPSSALFCRLLHVLFGGVFLPRVFIRLFARCKA